MKYYKFTNKLKDVFTEGEGLIENKIYPGDIDLYEGTVEFWAKKEYTKIDWEEVPEEEYMKQQNKEKSLITNQIPPHDLFFDEEALIPEQKLGTFSMMDFPMYKCHKEVGALKIKTIKNLPAPLGTYCPAKLEFEGDYATVKVDKHWMVKNKPQVGGYFVIYEDGYTSYSPEVVFEKGYTKIEKS